MKKFLSLCLAVVMMVSLLTCFTASAALEVPTVNYFFRAANFITTENSTINSIGWRRINPNVDRGGTGQFYDGSNFGILNSTNSSPGQTLSVNFYVETEGDYALFAWSKRWGKTFTIGIDDTMDAKSFGTQTDTKDYEWEKADTIFHLRAGVHTLNVIAGLGDVCISGLYLTNATELEASALGYDKDSAAPIIGDPGSEKLNLSLPAYADIVAPEFASGAKAILNYLGEGQVKIKLPAATDEGGIAQYKLFVTTGEGEDSEETIYVCAPDAREVLIDGFKEGDTFKTKVQAMDVFGNTKETAESECVVSKVDVSQLLVLKGRAEVTAVDQLVDKIAARMVISNTYTDDLTIRFSVAVYNKTTGAIEAGGFVTQTIAAEAQDVAVTVPTVNFTTEFKEAFAADKDNYEVKAHVWYDDMTPINGKVIQ